jgi:RNA polymerase sigma-70 factor (ECF subfamily)
MPMIQQQAYESIEHVFRQEGGRVRASLIRDLHDFELAEDVLQEAFLVALERWQRDGVPANPASWLLTTARHKAIDKLRRATAFASKQTHLQSLALLEQQSFSSHEDNCFPDEQLKLIFTCCHPALSSEARIALTLHTLGGLTTTEIAHAFLVSETTMAQRLVRAKRKIRDAGIPYEVPPIERINERLDGVLVVLYLIFNAGYMASLGESLIKSNLCAEAIRLCRSLIFLLANEPSLEEEPEALGLLALMLLHDSHRDTRIDAQGAMILLEQQDRSQWDKAQIAEGIATLERALAMHRPGSYQIQAAIAALHSEAAHADETDWLQIAMLYGELIKIHHSPVVKLNWAVAVAMASEPARGLTILDESDIAEALQNYHLYHSARADLLRRAGDRCAARTAYQQALHLAQNDVERAFLRRCLAEL